MRKWRTNSESPSYTFLRVQDYPWVRSSTIKRTNAVPEPNRLQSNRTNSTLELRLPTCPPPAHTYKINGVKDAGQNERLELLEGAMWGGSTDIARKYSGPEIPPPDAAEKQDETEEPLEDIESGEEGDGEDSASDAAAKKAPKMKAVARAVLMFGGMALCPKVDTLQSQVCVLHFRKSTECRRVEKKQHC